MSRIGFYSLMRLQLVSVAVVVENSKPGEKRKDKTFINSITRSRQAWNRVASQVGSKKLSCILFPVISYILQRSVTAQIGGTTIRVAKETDSKMAINSDQQKKNLRYVCYNASHILSYTPDISLRYPKLQSLVIKCDWL